MLRLRWLPTLLGLTLLGGMLMACQSADDTAPDTGEPAGEEMEGAEPAEEESAEDAAEGEGDAEGEAEEGADDEMGDMGAPSIDDLRADPLGTVEIAAGDPVELAAMFVLSGPNESLGVDSRDGVELAIDAFGEFMGHPIELTAEDSQCSAEGGQLAANRVAANENIIGVIGTSCSSAAEPAIPIIGDAGMVMISPSNTAPGLTAEDRPESFAGYLRTAHNDLFQGRVAAEFAYNELGLTTAATIHDGSPYAEQLQSVFADVFTELGGEITAQEAINVSDTDMGPVLTSIAASQPQIIYYPIFTAEGGFITQQAREVEGLADTALMGADGLFSPDFVKAAGEAADGVYLSGPYVGDSEAYAAFIDTLEETYGRPPLSGFHAHAYDATMIILNALAAASATDEDGTLVIGRQALRDAVYATDGYQGLTGTLSCDENGDCATGEALAVFQLTNDQVTDPDTNWPPAAVYQP